MAERSREAVERGLPNSQYAVTVVATGVDAECGDAVEADEQAVGMARIVGDVHESDALVSQPERSAFW